MISAPTFPKSDGRTWKKCNTKVLGWSSKIYSGALRRWTFSHFEYYHWIYNRPLCSLFVNRVSWQLVKFLRELLQPTLKQNQAQDSLGAGNLPGRAMSGDFRSPRAKHSGSSSISAGLAFQEWLELVELASPWFAFTLSGTVALWDLRGEERREAG